MNRISALLKKVHSKLLLPFLPCEVTAKRGPSKGSRCSTEIESAGAMILNFPIPEVNALYP